MMIALETLTVPTLRMFAVAAAAAATLGFAAAPPASANTTDHLPTRKQVCYLDPVQGKVCQWVWVSSGPIVVLPPPN